jgi:hypothetical protein
LGCRRQRLPPRDPSVSLAAALVQATIVFIPVGLAAACRLPVCLRHDGGHGDATRGCVLHCSGRLDSVGGGSGREAKVMIEKVARIVLVYIF